MKTDVLNSLRIEETERMELKQFVERVIDRFGGQIHLIKLFGSSVRGELVGDSDLDILVVAKQRSLDLFDKIKDIAIDSFFEYGRVISIKLYSVEQYDYLRELETPFMQNIQNEGVDLWKRS